METWGRHESQKFQIRAIIALPYATTFFISAKKYSRLQARAWIWWWLFDLIEKRNNESIIRQAHNATNAKNQIRKNEIREICHIYKIVPSRIPNQGSWIEATETYFQCYEFRHDSWSTTEHCNGQKINNYYVCSWGQISLSVIRTF